jgi:ring-1,2-phenylacetyl-CoA epoxidase subunit PaaE
MLYSLKVENIITETEDAVTLCFKQPSLKKIKYLAGQYLTVVVFINNRRYVRPYSFSSAPEIDKSLNITIKRVYKGIVSNHLCDKVLVGDIIQVMQPMGEFVLPQSLASVGINNAYFWGNGSGITPLFSLIKSALYTKLFDTVTLIYGNRNFTTTIFKKQIEELQQKFLNNFSVLHFHSKSTELFSDPNIAHGRIAPLEIFKNISNEQRLVNSVHYICGSSALKEAVKCCLAEFGVVEKNIFSEDFEIYRDPKDFEEIHTQDVSVNIAGENKIFEVTKGKSILEGGLDAMVDLEYSCQTGKCLLCRAKLLSGKTKTVGIKQLSVELAEKEILLCCSFPLTADVKVGI